MRSFIGAIQNRKSKIQNRESLSEYCNFEGQRKEARAARL